MSAHQYFMILAHIWFAAAYVAGGGKWGTGFVMGLILCIAAILCITAFNS
jgi:hypothetical protein